LGNDSDADNPGSLSASLIGGPSHGSITLGADGSFTYQHNGSSASSDSFTYVASDGITTSAVATVNISVGSSMITISFQNGLFPSTSYAGTSDARISSGSPTTNHGAKTTLNLDGSPDDASLLKWNLGAIPPGSTVQAVTITVNVTNPTSDTYEIYEVKRNWLEGQVTWNVLSSGNIWQTAGAQGSDDRGSAILGTVTSSSQGLKTLPLNAAGVSVVQSWVNNPSTNFGIIMQDYVSASDGIDLNSREIANASIRPRLTVVYVPATAQSGSTLAFTSAQSAPLNSNKKQAREQNQSGTIVVENARLQPGSRASAGAAQQNDTDLRVDKEVRLGAVVRKTANTRSESIADDDSRNLHSGNAGAKHARKQKVVLDPEFVDWLMEQGKLNSLIE
jgi:hypothetical protein